MRELWDLMYTCLCLSKICKNNLNCHRCTQVQQFGLPQQRNLNTPVNKKTAMSKFTLKSTARVFSVILTDKTSADVEGS